MIRREDKLSKKLIEVVSLAGEPLETTEILKLFPRETRTKVLYRLRILRGEGLLKGKAVGSGKQAWVWWVKNIFEDVKK